MDDIRRIERFGDATPTVVDDSIEKNCVIENTVVGGGIGSIVIDEDFVNEIISLMDENEPTNNLVELLTNISRTISKYFYSNDPSDLDRESFYFNNSIANSEGQIIGTKLSSIKGKNISACSEKSIAAYVILYRLYSTGKITRKPTLIISSLVTENTPRAPHAFVMISKDEDSYPSKHILYDVENPTIIQSENGEKRYCVGIYSLTDKDYDNIINGIECTPLSTYPITNPKVKDLCEKRTYGSKKPTVSLK